MNEPIAIVTADQNGTIIGSAGRATEWFGHTADDALGLGVEVLVPAEYRDGPAP